MKKPDFAKYDLVAESATNSGEYLVVRGPYRKGDKWMMIVNDRLFGRYERFDWYDKEVEADKFVLVSRGLIGRFKYMKLSKPAIVTAVVLFVLLFFGLIFAGNYNSLVTGRNAVDNSWSKVETQYQRRFDLIGNLVESVKGSQLQEQKVFKDIADGRKQYNAAQQTGNQNDQAAAASRIETNVALIPRLQEAYPELKSNQNVQALMGELSGTENGIAQKRDNYNDVVTNYNNNITRFPKNIFAGLFDFDKRSLFKAESSAAQAPKVDFSTKTE